MAASCRAVGAKRRIIIARSKNPAARVFVSQFEYEVCAHVNRPQNHVAGFGACADLQKINERRVYENQGKTRPPNDDQKEKTCLLTCLKCIEEQASIGEMVDMTPNGKRSG
jgi:hypothetical protein